MKILLSCRILNFKEPFDSYVASTSVPLVELTSNTSRPRLLKFEFLIFLFNVHKFLFVYRHFVATVL
jgi:hypothetical protein